MILRDYQIKSVREICASLDANLHPLLVLPTGAGKTVIAGEIIRIHAARGEKIAFLAHRKELIDQTSRKLDESGVPHGIIRADDFTRLDYRHAVQVCSIQTLVQRLHLGFNFDLLVFDECHHVAAATYLRIRRAFPLARAMGMTATPYRADGQGLQEIFDVLIEGASIRSLTERGYLVPARWFEGQAPDLRNLRTRNGDFRGDELERRVGDVQLVGDMLIEWRRHASQVLTVGFCVSIQHARQCTDRFMAAGIPAAVLHGLMSNAEREDIIARWAARQTLVVFNVGVLTEGFDLPAVEAIILARPTASRGLWKQMVGRGLRPWPDKTHCIVLDHAGCRAMHSDYDAPETYSLEGEISNLDSEPTESSNYRRCKACGAQFKSRGLEACPVCLEPIPAHRRIIEINGTLEEVLKPQEFCDDFDEICSSNFSKTVSKRIPFRKMRR